MRVHAVLMERGAGNPRLAIGQTTAPEGEHNAARPRSLLHSIRELRRRAPQSSSIDRRLWEQRSIPRLARRPRSAQTIWQAIHDRGKWNLSPALRSSAAATQNSATWRLEKCGPLACCAEMPQIRIETGNPGARSTAAAIRASSISSENIPALRSRITRGPKAWRAGQIA